MSQTKEWKVGDFCYHRDSGFKLNDDWVPVPCKIIEFEKEHPAIAKIRALNGQYFTTDTVENTHVLSECSEERFLSHAQRMLEEVDQEIEALEASLQTEKESRLKLRRRFQELGVKL